MLEQDVSGKLFKFKFIRDVMIEIFARIKLTFFNEEAKKRKAKAACLKKIQGNLMKINCHK